MVARKRLISLGLAVAVLLGTVSLLEAFVVPKEPAILPTKPVRMTMTVAYFSHEDHKEFACNDCHHTFEGYGEIGKCGDSGCHDDYKSKVGERSWFVAFHDKDDMRSCWGCHIAYKEADKTTGPTSCDSCHQSKK